MNAKINKIILFSFFISILVFLNNLIANAHSEELNPEDIVKKYYTADINGARLSSNTYNIVKPLILWENEPGWDIIFITRNAVITGKKVIHNNEIHIEARYHIIGIIAGEQILDLEFFEVINFILVKKDNTWKIKQPIFYPHVSPMSAKKHFEKLNQFNTNKDNSTLNNYKKIIKCLKDLE